MESIFIILAILVLFFFFVQKRFIKQEELKDSVYKKKGPILNAQEVALYNALLAAVGKHGVVLSKVSLTNVIAPMATDKKEWFIASNRISKSYFEISKFDFEISKYGTTCLLYTSDAADE